MDSGHNAINGGNAQGVYSSGGDIVLAPSGGAKKKRWPIVVAVLLFLIAIGAGIGAWVMSRPGGGDGGGGNGGNNSGVSSETLKGKFNIYANYVLFGKDSADDFSYDDASGIDPYFMTDGIDVNNYVKIAQDKFDAFDKVYYESEGKNEIMAMAVYFQYYAGLRLLTLQGVIDLYVDNGYEGTAKIINEKYSSDINNWNFSRYVESGRNLALAQLELVDGAGKVGCISGKTLVENCYSVPESVNGDIVNYKKDISEVTLEMFMDAMDAFDGVYKELYEKSR